MLFWCHCVCAGVGVGGWGGCGGKLPIKPRQKCSFILIDFPGGSDGKSVCLQCGRPGFDPWVGKIPWRRKRQPTPVLLPGKSHGRRSLVGCSPWGHKESATTERLHFHFSLSCIGEGHGNPLQYSCLENPRDGAAWWAAIYGVAQSRTQLKRLSSSSSSTRTRLWLSVIFYFPNTDPIIKYVIYLKLNFQIKLKEYC